MQNTKPFCLNPKKFKVFVLGADPSNKTINGKEANQLEYAFGILSDETRYFEGILKNLNRIGLHLEDLYVQNVIPEYLNEETGNNKDWEKQADKWLPHLKKELEYVEPLKKKPVFITAERIMKFLVNDGFTLPKAESIYSEQAGELFVVDQADNKLERNLIAFYRHPKYNLSKNEHYRNLLVELLKSK
ncbi:MAG: hypothetical protein JXR71_04140 [Bacteroidales bacterium]|nr:hypothetical protein [Bacteroidales bacterium]